MADPSNQRRFKRLRADYLMTYLPIGGTQEVPFATNIKDISATGVRFLSEHFFAEGTDMDVAVAIPPLGRDFRVKARVVRVRAAGKNTDLYYICLRFIEIDEKIQGDLNAFIEKLASLRGAKFMVDDPKRIHRRGAS